MTETTPKNLGNHGKSTIHVCSSRFRGLIAAFAFLEGFHRFEEGLGTRLSRGMPVR